MSRWMVETNISSLRSTLERPKEIQLFIKEWQTLHYSLTGQLFLKTYFAHSSSAAFLMLPAMPPSPLGLPESTHPIQNKPHLLPGAFPNYFNQQCCLSSSTCGALVSYKQTSQFYHIVWVPGWCLFQFSSPFHLVPYLPCNRFLVKVFDSLNSKALRIPMALVRVYKSLFLGLYSETFKEFCNLKSIAKGMPTSDFFEILALKEEIPLMSDKLFALCEVVIIPRL